MSPDNWGSHLNAGIGIWHGTALLLVMYSDCSVVINSKERTSECTKHERVGGCHAIAVLGMHREWDVESNVVTRHEQSCIYFGSTQARTKIECM